MAQACKVIAYACGYQPSDGHGNYWYDEYIDYVREKQIFTDFKAKDAFTRKYAKRIPIDTRTINTIIFNFFLLLA